MKRFWIFVLISACVIYGFYYDDTAPSLTRSFYESDTTVGTTWDSIYIGNTGHDKSVEFDNDGSVSLKVCPMNDTAAGSGASHTWHTVKAGEKEFTARFDKAVTFVRTKAASSTCSRRVKIWR